MTARRIYINDGAGSAHGISKCLRIEKEGSVHVAVVCQFSGFFDRLLGNVPATRCPTVISMSGGKGASPDPEEAEPIVSTSASQVDNKGDR